jgi:hypothetical protein
MYAVRINLCVWSSSFAPLEFLLTAKGILAIRFFAFEPAIAVPDNSERSDKVTSREGHNRVSAKRHFEIEARHSRRLNLGL